MSTDGLKIKIRSFSLEKDDGLIASYSARPSYDERNPADRYRSERDRRGFIACRTQLRSLLMHCIGGSLARIGFRYNRFAKPTLTPTLASPTAEFNVFDSGTYATCAVAEHRRVGVNLERLSLLAKLQDAAGKILSELEHAMFRATSCAGGRSRQSLRMWTRKEVMLKAWRGGLVDLHARRDGRRGGRGLHLSFRRSDV